MDNQNTSHTRLSLYRQCVLILVLMDNQNTKNIDDTLQALGVLILVLMDNQNTWYGRNVEAGAPTS